MAKEGNTPRLFVVGVGNLLLKDEGVGIHVVRRLREDPRPLPPEVSLIEAGLPGVGLLELLEKADGMVLIDAARMNKAPGTVIRFSPEELMDKPQGASFSSHDLKLPEVFALARSLSLMPRSVAIIGIEPGEISWGMELTPEVASSLPRVIELVNNELSSWCLPPKSDL
ncbi:MAG: hydrogenase maturation protease [Smithellaceae bacterium]|nr:hydrogenase maturation protease [Smithellaceae bacterium]